MSSNKRKGKKYRGSKTHGGGSMKKRRGAGSRGGRGKSGRGKRADQKKTGIWKDPNYLGRKGFTSVHDPVSALNILDVEKQLNSLLSQGVATKQDGTITLDLSDIGVEKLLGRGQVTKELALTVKDASDSAVRKIQEAGGSVTLTKESEE